MIERLAQVCFGQLNSLAPLYYTAMDRRLNPVSERSTISLSFPHNQPTPLLKRTFISYFSMTDQSISSHLRTLFELALQDYEIKTQMSLLNHPLAQNLDNCHSVESITILLQDQARSFGEFRGRDRVMKSIRSTVSFLYKISAIASLVDGMSLVRQKTLMTVIHVSNIVLQPCPPTRALYTGIGALLAVRLSSDPARLIRSDT